MATRRDADADRHLFHAMKPSGSSRSEVPFGPQPVPDPRVWVYAVIVAGVGAAALSGLLPEWPGLAHEVALPPLDFFADVRVLMAASRSIPVFAFGVVVAIVVRAALLATVIGSTRRHFGFAVRFYCLALAPAVLAAGLDFSGRAVLYSYLIGAGLFVTVVTFIAFGAAPWVGRDALHNALAAGARQRFRFAALGLYLVALTIVGTVWRRPDDVSQVLVVPLSGVLSAIAVRRLAAPPMRRLSPRMIAVAVGATVVLALVVPRFGGTASHVTERPRRGSLLLVAGVDTNTGDGAMFKLDPAELGFSCRQTFYYSYRGPGGGGPQGMARCPIRTGAPYLKSDTTRPLRQLAAGLRAQLVALPRPVVVVTHSQGAWIAWSAITGGNAAGVDELVMLAPFAEGLAPYPPPNADAAGAVGGVAVRLVTDLGRVLGISRFDPDAPLARELQGTPGAVVRLVGHPLPGGVRGAAVLARFDLALEPRPWPHGLAEACPGWLTHAELPTSSIVAATVDRFLDGGSLGTCPDWIAMLGHATDAFGAPGPAANGH
jgi:hypothetical protein